MDKPVVLVIKPKFLKKLRQLKILTKFIKNCKNPQWPNEDQARIHKTYQQNTLNWDIFITHSFLWYKTPEGRQYWDDKANN